MADAYRRFVQLRVTQQEDVVLWTAAGRCKKEDDRWELVEDVDNSSHDLGELVDDLGELVEDVKLPAPVLVCFIADGFGSADDVKESFPVVDGTKSVTLCFADELCESKASRNESAFVRCDLLAVMQETFARLCGLDHVRG